MSRLLGAVRDWHAQHPAPSAFADLVLGMRGTAASGTLAEFVRADAIACGERFQLVPSVARYAGIVQPEHDHEAAREVAHQLIAAVQGNDCIAYSLGIGSRAGWCSVVRSAAEASAILGQVGSNLRIPDRVGEPLGDGLPRYDLRDALASGSQGDVVEAVDRLRVATDANPTVVVKCVRCDSAATARGIEAEARSAATLNHPCAVGVVGEGIADTTAYIVFERVNGNSLVAMAATESLPNAEATVTLLAELAGAIWQLHAAGLCHGDIAPANVLLDRSSRLRLVDYGLSHQIDETSRVRDLVRLGELIQWMLLGFVPTSEQFGSGETRTCHFGLTARAVELGWELRRGWKREGEVEESLRSIVRQSRWKMLGLAAVGLTAVMVALTALALARSGGT